MRCIAANSFTTTIESRADRISPALMFRRASSIRLIGRIADGTRVRVLILRSCLGNVRGYSVQFRPERKEMERRSHWDGAGIADRRGISHRTPCQRTPSTWRAGAHPSRRYGRPRRCRGPLALLPSGLIEASADHRSAPNPQNPQLSNRIDAARGSRRT